MKTKPFMATLAAVTLTGAFAPVSSLAQGNSGGTQALIPAQPVGALSACPTIVQTGTKPSLTWNILYPSSVGNVAYLDPHGSITLTEKNIYVSVQMIGVGATDETYREPSCQRFNEARLSVNGSSYTQLFYGMTADVASQYSLYIKKHNKLDTISFGGRYVKNNNWTEFHTTRSSDMQVVILKNGDVIPTAYPLYTSPQLTGYLSPYLDGAGRVRIGPMSVLVLMELGTTNRDHPSFDYQDVALLVSFATKHPNNGHGNNLDGVDPSNPGRGVGGPTGLNNSGADPVGDVVD